MAKTAETHTFEVLSFKENESRKLQFLTGLEESLDIEFHWDYEKKIDAVCEFAMGKKTCAYCASPTRGMKSRVRTGFYVYDVDRSKIGVICTLDSYNAVLPTLCDLEEEVGLKGNTFLIDRKGYTKDSAWTGMQVDNEDVEIEETGLAQATKENMLHSIFEFWSNLGKK